MSHLTLAGSLSKDEAEGPTVQESEITRIKLTASDLGKMAATDSFLRRHGEHGKHRDKPQMKKTDKGLERKIAMKEGPNKFVVLTDMQEEVTAMTRKILHRMLHRLSENFEIHAYGKKQVLNAEKLSLSLYRWIEVVNIKTGYEFGDTYMIVEFKSAPGIHTQYKKAKGKAAIINERK